MKIGIVVIVGIGGLMVLSTTPSHSFSASPSTYVMKCQPCHGATGAGESPTGQMLNVKSFNDPSVLAMDDPALNDAISNGTDRMPAFGQLLSSDQINELVQYLHQLQANQSSN